jgi:hypothetical protein
MGMSKYIVLVLAVLAVATGPAASQTYRCTGQMRSGFSFDKALNQYTPIFSPAGSDAVYHLYQERGKWYWYGVSVKIGDILSGLWPCGDFNEYGWMHCGNAALAINRNSLRYQAVSVGDPPLVEVGRCIQCRSERCQQE